MDNRLADISTTDAAIRKIALLILAILSVILLTIVAVYQIRVSDPYIQSVLTLEGDPLRGHAIFQMNCAGCHGLYADGRVGPSLQNISEHRSRTSLIRQVISGKTPPMPQFQPSSQEMADLLRYLESL